jgi:uncharacterized protein
VVGYLFIEDRMMGIAQADFQQRWSHLNHPDVRSLAWLLDSSGLFNPDCPRWAGRLAELPPVNLTVANWLADLDKNPEPLTQHLAAHPQTRLGHYAENLLAFYFLWRGDLLAHRVQVHSATTHTTVGEFDFLLSTANGLEHWEFACKFYLFVAPFSRLSDYVGPNLVDNLDKKTRKILEGQLALSQHPDAKNYLSESINSAKALLKGWLFYPSAEIKSLGEIAGTHCRGLWCRLSELKKIPANCFAVLPRLQWLAPARQTQTMTMDQLYEYIVQQFVTDVRPVLVAQLVPDGEFFIECERIFVVPDEWGTW